MERIQSDRLCAAMAEVMTEKGYAHTSVEDVLRRAGVSRQSFYRIFSSKLDCFMTAFDRAGELLMNRVLSNAGPSTGPGDPLDVFTRAFTSYLDALADEWPFARLFLVEVYAAGPQALSRRTELQRLMAGTLADVLGVTGEAGRYTCRTIVAAVSTMVTTCAIENDPEALRALGPPLIAHAHRLWNAGMFEN